jgi:hypothetical protein
MIPTTPGAMVVIMVVTGDIPITEDPTGPDIIMAGIPATIMGLGDTTPNHGTVTAISAAGIPMDIPIVPGK